MEIQFRKATIDDAALLFDWRNDPATVAGSISSKTVEMGEHVGWLNGKLGNPNNSTILIAEIKRQPVGTVRFDYDEDGSEVSWTISPSSRGQGLGKRMVEQAIKQFGVGISKARVKADNIASIKIAKHVNLTQAQTVDDVLFFRSQDHVQS